MGEETREQIAGTYRRFASEEAERKSPIYARLARGVAASPTTLSFLAELPPEKRQPNLLLGALRHLGHEVSEPDALEHVVTAHTSELRDCILSHWTQTNEPGRCASLLPVFARLPQPLTLIEVGAAGGLCLFPDRYRYAYDDQRVGPAHADAPEFPCERLGTFAAPDRVPDVVARVGIDRAPIDLMDDDQVRWLEALVWPEQRDRAVRLREAIDVVRQDPPHIVEGDLIERLPEVVAEAPEAATTVVFHTAVLCYLPPERRHVFRELIASLPVTWISNEDARVFPDIDAPEPPRQPAFVVAVDGEAVATTDAHGGWLRPC